MQSKLCVTIKVMVIQMSTKIKTYSELMELPTFIERFRYLKIGGAIGRMTFGHDRYLNQILYSSDEWKRFRRDIIVRDKGCDLACEDREIMERAIVHHINPITVEDVIRRDPMIFDPENVITTFLRTHNAIHYADESILLLDHVERYKHDTCPWRQR